MTSSSLLGRTGNEPSPDKGSAPTSMRPTRVWASTKPAVTTLPAPSIRRAPAGTGAPAATATIRPPRITTVAFSMTVPGRTWTLAPTMAMSSARAEPATSSKTRRRFI